MKKVFIDGSAGTTGLRIRERLQSRSDIELLTIEEALRKDTEARRRCMNEADIVFLCLPDAAAIEAVDLIDNPNTVVIDTSTAHRTSDGWTYGFPEVAGNREKVRISKRIANPGCHASGVIALVEPLVRKGIIPNDSKLSAFSLTGYSGGGKKMIADYETPELQDELSAPRLYGLTQNHKHLPEITKVCGLTEDMIFCPVVSSYLEGMEVIVPIHASEINGTIEDVKNCYRDYYNDGLVKFVDKMPENGFLSAGKYDGRDDMEISVFGNDERITLVSRFDNLGKGASGAAIQNMNIVLGTDEKTGLITEEI